MKMQNISFFDSLAIYRHNEIMKKKSYLIIKIIGGLLLAIIVILFTIPVIFKDKIRTTIENSISESVNAQVRFGDYKLGFIRNFPNITFSIDDLAIVGIDKFENDTLIEFRYLSLVLNLPSLFKKSGYEVRSVRINEAKIKAIVLEDGSENWNIMKEEVESETEDDSTTGIKILLKKVEMLNSRITYLDLGSDIMTNLDDVNFLLSGDMTASETNLKMLIDAGKLTFSMEGMKYLNGAKASADIDLFANLDSMKFYLKENHLLINDLKLNFAGVVAMPGDDIETDLTFRTQNTSLKSLLSLIPSVFMSDYANLTTSGDIEISGFAKGIYSDSDSTMPDISLYIKIRNGLISYPSLPEKIKNIHLTSSLYADGTDMDKSTFDVENFHMELAGNPFDLKFSLKTPLSDPDFSGSMIGKLDLTALKKALPMDSLDLSGVIDLSVRMAGKMSMIDKGQYERFEAAGTMNISRMLVAMTGYPSIIINNAKFEFSPQYASLDNSSINVGSRSDFTLNGRIENYIPYLIKDEIIKGNINLRSQMLDLSEIMSSLAEEPEDETDTTSLAVIKIPENIDFDFNALIDQFVYNKIKANSLKGHIIARNGILSIRETGMKILGGSVVLNVDYDTRNMLKPFMSADLEIQNLGIKDAFNTFNTVQKLAPAANGMDGRIGIKLSYSSLLGRDFMPVIQTVTGGGKLQSDEVKLMASAAYNKMKDILKLNENYSNTFRDINLSFKINQGRLYVNPFNTRAGNIKFNISGDQGLDQTLNYIVKSEIPRTELGAQVNTLINGLSAQASAFGFAFKPSELIKVNVKVTGTFLNPVITPFFGDTPPDGTSLITKAAKENIKEFVETKTDEVKQTVKNELSEQADRLIQEAEEQGKFLRSEAEKAAETIRKEADLQAQKLIKEAEPKGTVARIAASKGAESIRKEADKKAAQLVKEADEKALRLVEEAKIKRDQLLKENQQ